MEEKDPDGQIKRSRALTEAAKAQSAALDLRKKKGELVDRRRASDHVRQLAAEERDALIRFPADRARAIAENLGVDATEVERVLDLEIRAHLERRSGARIEVSADV